MLAHYTTLKREFRNIYIKDINSNVLLAKDGVVHGLQGNKTNSGTMNTAIVSRALPRILRNSIAVNELNPRSEKDGVFPTSCSATCEIPTIRNTL